MDLAKLAADASAQLAAIWDNLGVSQQERSNYLQGVCEQVAGVYSGSVARQQERMKGMEQDIDRLRATITDMQFTMQEEQCLAVRGSASLLEYKDFLDAQRSELQKLWDSRHAQLEGLHSTLTNLYADIGSPVEGSFSGIGDHISLARLSEYGAEIRRVTEVKAARAAKIAEVCAGIVEMWQVLGREPSGDLERRIAGDVAGLGWSESAIATLEAKHAALSVEFNARRDRVAAMGVEIKALWERLRTPLAEQETFMEIHTDYADDTMVGCEKYLAAKQAEFRTKLVELMAGARAAIASTWDAMRAGPQQRRLMFPGFFVGHPSAFTNDLFEAHEKYLEVAQKQLALVAPLVKAVEDREDRVRAKAELAQLQLNPGRLKTNKAEERKHEENLEKKAKALPGTTKRVQEAIAKWEAENKARFVLNDVPYAEALAKEEAEEKRIADERAAARKGGIPDASAAPKATMSASVGPSARPSVKPAGAMGTMGGPAAKGAALMGRGPSAVPSASAAAAGAPHRPLKASTGASSVGASLHVASDNEATGSMSAAAAARPKPSTAAPAVGALGASSRVEANRGAGPTRPGKITPAAAALHHSSTRA